jgi:hypothetical protein
MTFGRVEDLLLVDLRDFVGGEEFQVP